MSASSQDSKRYADDVLFRFHWRDGKKHEGYGRDVADAFSRLGFGGGAIRALDYYERVSDGLRVSAEFQQSGSEK